MKYINTIMNVIIIGFIIYVIIKWRNNQRVSRSGYNVDYYPSSNNDLANSRIDFAKMKPLNFSQNLIRGYKGTEVYLLQMMLQKYDAKQPLTGVMDDYTMGHLDWVRESKSITNLDGFANTYFIPDFSDKTYKDLVNIFNSR